MANFISPIKSVILTYFQLHCCTFVSFKFVYTVSLHKVVEVREGQKTAMFDKFPYEQVDKQSFSLIYQQEGT